MQPTNRAQTATSPKTTLSNNATSSRKIAPTTRRKKAVILADGSFPTRQNLITQILKAPYLIVCDGASSHIARFARTPDAIIGDLDSITPRLKKRFKSQLIHISEQDTNDLTKAFNHCVNLGFEDITIFGATGKREDHMLANIFLLERFGEQVKSVRIKSDYGEFSYHTTPCTLSAKKGQQISIFSLDKEARLTSSGLKYPLTSLALKNLNAGTLNEALGTSFSLTSEQDSPLAESKSQNHARLIIYKAYAKRAK